MIRIRNIYYMLSYAFRVLQEDGYKKLAGEVYENIADLYAEILSTGIEIQLKRGLGKEYLLTSEPLSTLRGKMDISESITTMTLMRKQMICSYDVFTVNTEMNRILKSTVQLLMKSNASLERKKRMRNLMMYFGDVDTIDLRSVRWNHTYNRNNQNYKMLISICYLVYTGMLLSTDSGQLNTMTYIDDQRMCKLYEKFILEYYRKEHPELHANASQIKWQLDDDFDAMLPKMQTDIMLSNGNNILIIDAKYYSHATQLQFGINTLHSGNLYQVFTYVKNKEYELRDVPHQVSGVLLYAQTDEEVLPDSEYKMSGNRIAARTLDLNQPFEEIRKKLDLIAKMLE